MIGNATHQLHAQDTITNNRMKLSRPQSKAFLSVSPLNLLMAGQRAGKSQMAGVISGRYIQQYPTIKGFIGANTYMQLSQSTLVKAFEVWRDLYGMTEYDSKRNPHGWFVVDKHPPAHFHVYEKFKDYHNIISFANGAVVYLGSLDNWKAHDGKEFGWAHLDETKDTKEEAVTTVILARLSGQGLYVSPDGKLVYVPHIKPQLVGDPNTVWIPNSDMRRLYVEQHGLKSFNPAWIHTSPAVGQVDWLVDLFHLGDYEAEIRQQITGVLPDGRPDYFYKEIAGKKAVVIFSTYHNEENLPASYIENRKSVLTENEQMKFIYGYPFSKTGGEYFPHFERTKHVMPVAFDPFLSSSHITFDFNVVPYMTMLACQVSYVTRYYDADGKKHLEYAPGLQPREMLRIAFYKEYPLASPLNTTEHCCNAWRDDHVGRPGLDLYYYGDASGRNRIEGMGSLTNYKVVEKTLRPFLTTASDRVRRSNIAVLKRRELMNKIFEGKVPVELVFDEGMKETIRDFEYLKLGPDGKLKERTKDPSTGITYEKIGHTSDAVEYLVCELCKQYIETD